MYVHNNFLNEKWVNRRYCFVDEKNLEKLGVTGGLLSVYSQYMMIRFFHSQVLVLQFVKSWLTVVKFVLIVASNYLTTVKQGLIIRFFQEVCAIEKILIRCIENKRQTSEEAEMLKIPMVNIFFSYMAINA